MKAAFLVAVLVAALLYTYAAFVELTFLTMTGRLGPGFFPRVIGVLLVVACLYNLFVLARPSSPEAGEREGGDWRITAAVVALSAGFFGLPPELRGPLAVVVFLFSGL